MVWALWAQKNQPFGPKLSTSKSVFRVWGLGFRGLGFRGLGV